MKKKESILKRQENFPIFCMIFSLAAKVISLEVNKAGLVDIIGFTGEENIHGEKVKKLDIFSNDMMIKAMDHGGHL